MEYKGPPIFKAWLVFVILSTLLGALAGAIVGGFVGMAMGLSGNGDIDAIRFASGIAGFIAGLPVSFLVFQRVVNRFIVPNVWKPEPTAQQRY